MCLFAVNSLKEFGKLLSNIEDEREKIVSGIISIGGFGYMSLVRALYILKTCNTNVALLKMILSNGVII